MEIAVRVEINQSFLKHLEEAKQTALAKTGDEMRTDLILSQTMPFDVGVLQNESTFVHYEKIARDSVVSLVSSTPYARRLYFHPEYNFQRGENPNAGGRWFDPYLSGGAKADFVGKTFARHLKLALGG